VGGHLGGGFWQVISFCMMKKTSSQQSPQGFSGQASENVGLSELLKHFLCTGHGAHPMFVLPSSQDCLAVYSDAALNSSVHFVQICTDTVVSSRTNIPQDNSLRG